MTEREILALIRDRLSISVTTDSGTDYGRGWTEVRVQLLLINEDGTTETIASDSVSIGDTGA